MVKCPNCGSTAQVVYDGHDNVYCATEGHTHSYHCGCGCEFEVEYKAVECIVNVANKNPHCPKCGNREMEYAFIKGYKYHCPYCKTYYTEEAMFPYMRKKL